MGTADAIEAVRDDDTGQDSRRPSDDCNGHSAPAIRVFIADDQPFMRMGLRILINNESDMEVCGEAWERACLIKEIKRTKPQVVIMELYLGDDETIGLIRQIRSLNQGIEVVVLSRHDEMVYAVPTFKAGARAYVMKHEEPRAVITAIREVHCGRAHFSWDVSALLVSRMTGAKTPGRDVGKVMLSPRELEVVALIASGYSSREIASRLRISIKTVEAHRAHIKQKANLDNSAALIRFSMAVANDSSLVAV